MQQYINTFSFIVRASIVVILATIPCYGNDTKQTEPHGLVVSSVLVNPAEYTADGGRYDLYLQDVPEGKTTRLTDHQANPELKLGGAIRKPLFSHDRKRVIFLADYSDSDDRRTTMTGAAPYPNTFLNIWEVTIGDRKISPITKGDFGWRIYGWSPDDRYICAVYQSKMGSLDQDTPIPDDIYVWDMQTKQGRRLARVPNGVADAFWSHDGSSIIYQSGPTSNLYSVPIKGGKSKMLLQGKAGRFGYNFSPDGRQVAYVDINIVYIANADGSDPNAVIKIIRNDYSPYSPKLQWSVDGKKLAVYELSQNAQAPTKIQVYDVVTEKENVVATLQEFVTDLVWSKNGQWFIVKILRAGNTEESDQKTGWHTFHREGLLAVSITDGHIVTLKEPNEETKGLDWFENE